MLTKRRRQSSAPRPRVDQISIVNQQVRSQITSYAPASTVVDLCLSSYLLILFHSSSFLFCLLLSLSGCRLSLCDSECDSQLRCSFVRSLVIKRRKMNNYRYYGYQEKNTLTSCEEMRVEPMICPKPRRLGLKNNYSINTHIRPSPHPIICLQYEVEDSGVGTELLDIILPKENCYLERSEGQVVASSPPYFCGSPPSRASNPLIQDEQFGNGNFSPFTEASSSSSARGCVPKKFGHTPAAVRIEGFDCLNRDRRSCSISAVA